MTIAFSGYLIFDKVNIVGSQQKQARQRAEDSIVKQLQNTKNKNNILCINILRFKFNPVCHYEPSRKAWRGNPVKKS